MRGAREGQSVGGDWGADGDHVYTLRASLAQGVATRVSVHVCVHVCVCVCVCVRHSMYCLFLHHADWRSRLREDWRLM